MTEDWLQDQHNQQGKEVDNRNHPSIESSGVDHELLQIRSVGVKGNRPTKSQPNNRKELLGILGQEG